jgi:hypothetical protein
MSFPAPSFQSKVVIPYDFIFSKKKCTHIRNVCKRGSFPMPRHVVLEETLFSKAHDVYPSLSVKSGDFV